MEYYDESVLMALASAVGRPVRVDIKTVDASRAKFARMCVEINLDQPVVRRLWFRDHWYHVEYEGVHLLCKQCGIFGHMAKGCPKIGGKSKGSMVQQETMATTNLYGFASAGKENAYQQKTNLNSNGDKSGNPEVQAVGEMYGNWLVVNKFRRPKISHQKKSSKIKERITVKGLKISFKYWKLMKKES